uniref:Uncharacterized protein n=1 Tax=Oryza meridionalis TaxID=40149 RepID=A0A0E0F2R5_9ORYZ
MGRDEPLSGGLISELRLSSSLPSRDPLGPDRRHLVAAGLFLSRLVPPSLLHTRQMGAKRGGRMARPTSSRRGQGRGERRRMAQLTRSRRGAGR